MFNSAQMPAQEQPMEAAQQTIIDQPPPPAEPMRMESDEPSLRGGFFEECSCCGCEESFGCC